ncbi:hypothetical protein QJS66_23245 [Kocuria rhizophila]|nr:hypothetical protein QJS66_23245 [Kocuria rhizophila]
MSSVFTKIIEGGLPGGFVWADERAVHRVPVHPAARPGPRARGPAPGGVDAWISLPRSWPPIS